jgi:hypothetical protein
MAYRAHLMVYGPDGKRIGLTGLKAAFPNGVRHEDGWLLAHVGTRQGAPGIWVERDGCSKGYFAATVTSVVRKISSAYTASTVRAYATNKPSADALAWDSFYAGRG